MDEALRVLVVDDEPQILRVLRRAFQSEGITVMTAPDAQTGLDMFRTAPIDLVITDLRMPDMNGVELTRKLRSFSQVPVIVISIKGDEAIKVQALDSGADDYVTKPFGMEELLARVRALTRRAQSGIPNRPTLEAGDFAIDPNLH